MNHRMNLPDIPDFIPDCIFELREAFNLFDIKGVGEIRLSELIDSMQSLGFNDKNPMMFEMMLKLQAKDKGGTTTFTKFAEDLAVLIREDKEEEDLRIIFGLLDENNTGRISLDNVKKVAKEFGDMWSDAELLEMVDTAKQHVMIDTLGEAEDNLTEVSFDEFYRLMTLGKEDSRGQGSNEEGAPRDHGLLT